MRVELGWVQVVQSVQVKQENKSIYRERIDMELTIDQSKALNMVMKGKNTLILGEAGTGKTFLLKHIVNELSNLGKNVVVCAPTGMASLNIDGITIHRAFGFRSEVQINTVRSSFKTRTSGVVSKADVIVIDEVSMVRMDLFDAIIVSVRKIENKQKRKIQLILAGDFCQLPPVVTSKDKSLLDAFYQKDVEHAYAFQATYWNRCKLEPMVLTTVIRQKDKEFINALNQLRVGDASCLKYLNQSVHHSVEGIHIYNTNRSVIEKNKMEVDKLEGPLTEQETKVSVLPGYTKYDIDPEILSSLPPTLKLKPFAKIIMTSNDDPYHKNTEYVSTTRQRGNFNDPYFQNGTFGTFLQLADDTEQPSAIVKINGKHIMVNPVTRPIYEYVIDGMGVKKVCVATYTYLPFKLAYAITVHRSQGQTYSSAVYHSGFTFSPGQTYVALSRVKEFSELCLEQELTYKDIMIAPEVLEFNKTIWNIIHKKQYKKMGRPPKNENGTVRDQYKWIPKALEKHVRKELESNKEIPLDLKKIKKEKGRVHMRVPTSMLAHIEEEIQAYKNEKLL